MPSYLIIIVLVTVGSLRKDLKVISIRDQYPNTVTLRTHDTRGFYLRRGCSNHTMKDSKRCWKRGAVKEKMLSPYSGI